MAFLAAIPAALSAAGSAIAGGVSSIGSALGGMSLGTVFQAGGTILSGLSALGAANYQADMAEQNARVMKENADRAIHRSQEEAHQQDVLTRAMLGEQIAAQGASGLSLMGRSQLMTRRAASKLGRRDTLNVRHAGEVEAHNYRVAATGERAQAQMSRASGMGSLLGSFLRAGSLLGQSRSSNKRFSQGYDFAGPWGASLMR